MINWQVLYVLLYGNKYGGWNPIVLERFSEKQRSIIGNHWDSSNETENGDRARSQVVTKIAVPGRITLLPISLKHPEIPLIPCRLNGPGMQRNWPLLVQVYFDAISKVIIEIQFLIFVNLSCKSRGFRRVQP